jgi:hypothetical protein
MEKWESIFLSEPNCMGQSDYPMRILMRTLNEVGAKQFVIIQKENFSGKDLMYGDDDIVRNFFVEVAVLIDTNKNGKEKCEFQWRLIRIDDWSYQEPYVSEQPLDVFMRHINKLKVKQFCILEEHNLSEKEGEDFWVEIMALVPVEKK